ncbi:MAG: ribose 5-phosphate isomerase B [Clostridia bacterium]
MKIAIGSDHGGFLLKNELITYLGENNFELRDFGCFNTNSVDYPDIASSVARAVVSGEFERGILICGTGIGVSICANKINGVRCALCSEPVSAKLARAHNDANILALGARIIGFELAKAIVNEFLTSTFDGGRHSRRIEKISLLEE